MYRVALAVGMGLLLSACSLNTQSLSFGHNSQPTATASLPNSKRAPSGALGGEPATQREATKPAGTTKIAKLDDKAPVGTYEKAQQGALADRDYSSTNLDAERARQLINAYRAEKGLKPLKLNTELTIAAKNHSRDLAKWDRISHFGSDGSNPWDRVKRSGYNARLAAENVGTGQVTIDEVMKGWKDSPGHNKNLLLADAEHMGIALVQAPKAEFKTFWTLVIGAPMQ
jgi:uncharacterized protein YkwD